MRVIFYFDKEGREGSIYRYFRKGRGTGDVFMDLNIFKGVLS